MGIINVFFLGVFHRKWTYRIQTKMSRLGGFPGRDDNLLLKTFSK